jgi:RNA polymerase sigma-70 factor (ECF subfamily)
MSPSPATQPSAHTPHDVRAGLAPLRRDLYVQALRLTRAPAHAEDLVQDTMLRALRFEGQFRHGTNLRAWVRQVMLSVFLTHCRRGRRERRALERLMHDPCAWTHGETPSPARALSPTPERALAALPPPYRHAVELVDLQGLCYRDAAARLNVPVGTIMSRLHRGRRLLAAALVEAAAPPCAAAA